MYKKRTITTLLLLVSLILANGLTFIHTSVASTATPPPLPAIDEKSRETEKEDEISFSNRIKNLWKGKNEIKEEAESLRSEPPLPKPPAPEKEDNESFIDLGSNNLPKTTNQNSPAEKNIDLPPEIKELTDFSETPPSAQDKSDSTNVKAHSQNNENIKDAVEDVEDSPQDISISVPVLPEDLSPPLESPLPPPPEAPAGQAKTITEPPKKTNNFIPSPPVLTKNKNIQEVSPGNDPAANETAKFVSDEAKVLLLPSDDVVLGKLTQEAKLEQMDFDAYLVFFIQEMDKTARAGQQTIIENFRANYDDNFNQEKFKQPPATAAKEAFMAVSKDNINNLRALLDNYSILQNTDAMNNSMLHIAAATGNYHLAKFLLIRGIDLSTLNHEYETALGIAQKQHNRNLFNLLKSSGAY